MLRNDVMRQYMYQNHDAWYRFAKNTLGLAIKQEEILFVRGLLQTSDWAGIAAFLQEGRAGTLTFDTGAVAPFSVSFSAALLREVTAPIQWRIGPNNSGRVKKDQTVFLQFYKMKKRMFGGPRVVKAAAEPRGTTPTPDNDDEMCSATQCSSDTSDEDAIELVPRLPKVRT